MSHRGSPARGILRRLQPSQQSFALQQRVGQIAELCELQETFAGLIRRRMVAEIAQEAPQGLARLGVQRDFQPSGDGRVDLRSFVARRRGIQFVEAGLDPAIAPDREIRFDRFRLSLTPLQIDELQVGLERGGSIVLLLQPLGHQPQELRTARYPRPAVSPIRRSDRASL